jgi:Protein of unknown function (DUF1236)
MKAKASVALAAALLLSGATIASAAGMSHTFSTLTMSKPLSDTISLSSTQQKMAWNDLKSTATKQTSPSALNAKIGSVIPSTLKLETIPGKAAKDVPSLRGYDFAMVQNKLLIVNPSDRKIVDLITG